MKKHQRCTILWQSLLGYWIVLVGILCIDSSSAFAVHAGMKIHNTSNYRAQQTDFDAGPCAGDILNIHYFPGIVNYAKGHHSSAIEEMDYVIFHPSYTRMNPRHAELMSYAYYIRGKILVYHASGPKRLLRAKQDFEDSIQYNARNYASYLELGSLLAANGMPEQSRTILQRLLDVQPDAETAQQARSALSLLQSRASK